MEAEEGAEIGATNFPSQGGHSAPPKADQQPSSVDVFPACPCLTCCCGPQPGTQSKEKEIF